MRVQWAYSPCLVSDTHVLTWASHKVRVCLPPSAGATQGLVVDAPKLCHLRDHQQQRVFLCEVYLRWRAEQARLCCAAWAHTQLLPCSLCGRPGSPGLLLKSALTLVPQPLLSCGGRKNTAHVTVASELRDPGPACSAAFGREVVLAALAAASSCSGLPPWGCWPSPSVWCLTGERAHATCVYVCVYWAGGGGRRGRRGGIMGAVTKRTG